MPAFRRVEDVRAGATAIGILVPPGLRTFVILRPRALSWDLLPITTESEEGFCQFERDEAASLARQVQRGLQDERLHAGFKAISCGFQVWLRVCGFTWIVCPRVPGSPYQPLVFADREHAQEAVNKLLAFFHPPKDAEQEYYFNTQNFVR